MPVMEGVAIGNTGYAQFAVAGNGSLAYVPGGAPSAKHAPWCGSIETVVKTHSTPRPLPMSRRGCRPRMVGTWR